MLRRDTRAQSVGIAKFLLSLMVAAMLAWIVNRIATPILEGAEAEASTQTAAQASQWLQVGTDNLFLAFLVIAVFGLISLSIVQREVLG